MLVPGRSVYARRTCSAGSRSPSASLVTRIRKFRGHRLSTATEIWLWRSFQGRPASRPAALGLRRLPGGITHCHEERTRAVDRGVDWPPGIPSTAAPSVRSRVSSVQLTRPLDRNVLMARRKSTVRFRNGARRSEAGSDHGTGLFSSGAAVKCSRLTCQGPAKDLRRALPGSLSTVN
jgi:hypothetical protein